MSIGFVTVVALALAGQLPESFVAKRKAAQQALGRLELDTALKLAKETVLIPGVPDPERAQAYVFLGSCYAQLGDEAHAVDALLDALEYDPTIELEGRAPPGALEATKRAQKNARAPLRVITAPAGAAVRLDGKPVGNTPLVVDAAPGEHRLEAALSGHQTETRTVTVRMRSGAAVSFALSALGTSGADASNVNQPPAVATKTGSERPNWSLDVSYRFHGLKALGGGATGLNELSLGITGRFFAADVGVLAGLSPGTPTSLGAHLRAGPKTPHFFSTGGFFRGLSAMVQAEGAVVSVGPGQLTRAGGGASLTLDARFFSWLSVFVGSGIKVFPTEGKPVFVDVFSGARVSLGL